MIGNLYFLGFGNTDSNTNYIQNKKVRKKLPYLTYVDILRYT